MTSSAAARSRPAVRLPFRVLAAFIWVAFVGVALGMAYMTWKNGVSALRVHDVVMVPGLLWFARLLFYAAVRGTVPISITWPFATPGVSQGYWLIVTCLWLATP